MKSLLDKDFPYVHSTRTDVRKTFDRIRREREKAAADTAQKVAQLKRGRAPCSQK